MENASCRYERRDKKKKIYRDSLASIRICCTVASI